MTTTTQLETVNVTVENVMDVNGQSAAKLLSRKGGEGSETSVETSLVECKLCGFEGKQLQSHLLFKHKLTVEQYKAQFPEAEIYSESAKKKNTELNKQRWAEMKKEDKAKMIGGMLSTYNLPENRKKQGEALSKNRAKMSIEELRQRGEKGLNKAREVVKANPDEYSKRCSEAIKKSFKEHPERLEKAREQILKLAKQHHDKVASMPPEELINYLQSSFLKKPVRYSVSYKEVELTVRSSYEEIVAKALVDLQVKFSYESMTLKQPNGKNYWIDFHVEPDLIIEVRSDYWVNKEPEKMQQREQAVVDAGYRFLLLTDEQIFSDNLHSIIGFHATSAQPQKEAQ